MKYYIVDDVLGIVKVLARIIEEKDLGEVIGFSTDAETAEREIIAKVPDLVLVDLLMPVKDGITIVHNVKSLRPNINFIMISQVSDKEMVAEAYKEGVEFFISKPINIIEVENVLNRVAEKVNMANMLGGIRQMMRDDSSHHAPSVQNRKEVQIRDIKYILGLLGVLGERGTKDILSICEILLQQNNSYDKNTIAEYSSCIGEDYKMVQQRIRRAIKKGLTNMAAMGIEDYSNEIFQTYSYMVFDFECIKLEMDFLRKKHASGGKANTAKFMEGLLTFSEQKE